MNVCGKFIASLSNITKQTQIVYLVWNSDGFLETGKGMIVSFPTDKDRNAWQEAIKLWNQNRNPTDYCRSQYRALEQTASNLLPSIFTRRLT